MAENLRDKQTWELVRDFCTTTLTPFESDQLIEELIRRGAISDGEELFKYHDEAILDRIWSDWIGKNDPVGEVA